LSWTVTTLPELGLVILVANWVKAYAAD
jgi:hypothetical protein